MNRIQGMALLALVAIGCGGSDGPPGPSETAPAAPAQNDPAYEVRQIKGWYLVGNDLTPGQDELLVQVLAPEGTGYVDMWIDDGPGIRLEDAGTDFRQLADISALAAGEHTVLLAADGSDTAFARITFRRSHPLYVVVTTDWDDADNTELALQLQEQLHVEHPRLLITHFPGPYTFTDPEVSPARRAELAEWLLGMQADYGDEIGLHIHPYCNFVEDAGLACKHAPSTVYETDETGYTVMCSAYSVAEFTELLLHADALFAEAGLPKPTSFRAGGWTADAKVLQALHDAGHVADTSANNWQRMEEWKDQQNGVLYEWNQQNWSEIGDTSQPYYPSVDDIQSGGGTPIGILEVPDNGILVDYVSSLEMIEIFEANWDGTPLPEPRQFSIGWHPSNFNPTLKGRMSRALQHVDRFLAADHAGPVVYARLSDLPLVWKQPQ